MYLTLTFDVRKVGIIYRLHEEKRRYVSFTDYMKTKEGMYHSVTT